MQNNASDRQGAVIDRSSPPQRRFAAVVVDRDFTRTPRHHVAGAAVGGFDIEGVAAGGQSAVVLRAGARRETATVDLALEAAADMSVNVPLVGSYQHTEKFIAGTTTTAQL